MLVFFDRYTENVEKLRETMRCMGRDAKITVLRDDGFLPSGISSPYEFFVYRNRHEDLSEKTCFIILSIFPHSGKSVYPGGQQAAFLIWALKRQKFISESLLKKEMCSGWNGIWKTDGCIKLIITTDMV